MTRLIYYYEKTDQRSVSIYKKPLQRHNVYAKKKKHKQTNPYPFVEVWWFTMMYEYLARMGDRLLGAICFMEHVAAASSPGVSLCLSAETRCLIVFKPFSKKRGTTDWKRRRFLKLTCPLCFLSFQRPIQVLLLYRWECSNLRKEGGSVRTRELHLCDRNGNWIFPSVRDYGVLQKGKTILW